MVPNEQCLGLAQGNGGESSLSPGEGVLACIPETSQGSSCPVAAGGGARGWERQYPHPAQGGQDMNRGSAHISSLGLRQCSPSSRSEGWAFWGTPLEISRKGARPGGGREGDPTGLVASEWLSSRQWSCVLEPSPDALPCLYATPLSPLHGPFQSLVFTHTQAGQLLSPERMPTGKS